MLFKRKKTLFLIFSNKTNPRKPGIAPFLARRGEWRPFISKTNLTLMLANLGVGSGRCLGSGRPRGPSISSEDHYSELPWFNVQRVPNAHRCNPQCGSLYPVIWCAGLASALRRGRTYLYRMQIANLENHIKQNPPRTRKLPICGVWPAPGARKLKFCRPGIDP